MAARPGLVDLTRKRPPLSSGLDPSPAKRQHIGSNPTNETTDTNKADPKEAPDEPYAKKIAIQLCQNVRPGLESLEGILELVDAGLQVNTPDGLIIVKTPDEMFKLANRLDKSNKEGSKIIAAPPGSLQWMLCAIAANVMKAMGHAVTDLDDTEAQTQRAWIKYVSMLNSIAPDLNSNILRLYMGLARVNYFPKSHLRKNIATRLMMAKEVLLVLKEALAIKLDKESVLWLPRAIEKLSGLEYQNACENSGLGIFANVRIESLFVSLGEIKAKLMPVPTPVIIPGIIPLNTDKTFQSEVTRAAREVFRTGCQPATSPLHVMQHYELLSTPDELQTRALEAGESQEVDNGPVYGNYNGIPYCFSEGVWSSPHTVLRDRVISHLVTLGFLKRGERPYLHCHVLHHVYGPILTPQDMIQIVMLVTEGDFDVSVGGYALGEVWFKWNIGSIIMLNRQVRFWPMTLVRYVSILVPVEQRPI